MAAARAVFSGAYLLVVLHLLLLLVVLELHVVSLALLLSYFISLPAPRLKVASPSASRCTDSSLETSHIAEAHPHTEQLLCVHSEGQTRQRHAATPPRIQNPSPPDAALALHCGAAGVITPVCPPPYSPVFEAAEAVEAEVSVSADSMGDAQLGCHRESSHGSSAGPRAKMETSDTSRDDSLDCDYDAQSPSDAEADAPHSGWVWAVAVVSLVSLCATILLWLFVSRCTTTGAAGAGGGVATAAAAPNVVCRAPAWATRTVPRTLLALLAGIHIDTNGVRQRDFFLTVAALSVAGSLSIAQALWATLLRRRHRRRRAHRSSCRLANAMSRIGVLVIKALTLVPLSLLWVGVSGVGQGTVLGCLHVLLATVVLLTYPRCVLSWRRRCWLLYVSLLLLLWTLQSSLRLSWVRASLEEHAAPSPTRQRILAVWGVLPMTASASAEVIWRVVQVIGVWWAGLECLCLHTATYAVVVAPPRFARSVAGAQRRACLLRLLAAKEARQLARAVELQRAAHRKVEELSLACTGVWRDPAADAGGGARLKMRHALSHESFPCERPHVPFGDVGSRHRRHEERITSARSTKAFQRSSHHSSEVEAAFDSGWSSIRASAMNSARSSPHEQRDHFLRASPSWTCLLKDSSNAKARSTPWTSMAAVAHPARGAATAQSPHDGSDGECITPVDLREWPPRLAHQLEAHGNERRELLHAAQLLDAAANSPSRHSPFTHDRVPGASPFHSVASASLERLSPIACVPRGSGFDSPPPVETTALMMPLTAKDGRGGGERGKLHARAVKSEAAVASGQAVGEGNGQFEAGENDAPTQASMPCGAARSLLRKMARFAKAYLHTHTLDADGAEADCPHSATPTPVRDSTLPHSEPTHVDAAVTTVLSEAAAALPQCSLLVLLRRYLLQHWVWVRVLLSLVHFAVSCTALNLLPSVAGLAYALLPRPWPPACYLRLEAIAAAVSLFGKCLARAILATSAGPETVSWTAVRCVNAVLLRLRVTHATEATLLSTSPAWTVSVDCWDSRLDLALSLAVLCAAVVHWAVVYPDACMLGGGCNDEEQTRRAMLEENSKTDPEVAVPLPTGEVLEQQQQQQRTRRGCAEQICRWNRHRRGAGADYYTIQLFFDLLAVALFCWAYYIIAPDNTAPSQDNLLYAVQHNRLPGTFVATVLGLVVVVFLERILYVLHSLAAKYATHLLLAIAYHALYLAWTVTRDGADGVASRSSTTAPVALLLSAKLASLWCGALQLRHGYPLHRNHDPFTVKTDVAHWLGHMLFRAVPFVLELRVLLDWSFSATTLKVQHWMLLEDIHHTVYRRYVDMHDLHWTSRRQGRGFPYHVRVYQGMLSFTVILLMLFFPLFWYSTFGPQVHASQVTAWSTVVSFEGFSALPLYTSDAVLTTTTFRDVATTPVAGVLASSGGLLRSVAVSDTWQRVQPSQCSSRMWSYTPAALTQLIDELLAEDKAGSARLVVHSQVTRSRAAEAIYKTCRMEESYTLPRAAAEGIARVLESWRETDANSTSAARPVTATVALPGLYTPYVLSSGSSVVAMATAGVVKANCTLSLHRVGPFRGFACVDCGTIAAIASGEEAQLPVSSASSDSSAAVDAAPQSSGTFGFTVASTDVTTVQSSLSLIPNVGIIALYTSFILVMSSYIRSLFAGDAHRVILLQLANPEPVAELLRFIYLVRSEASNGQPGELPVEQLLFLELLDLLRSPERLLALGGRRVDDYAGGVYRESLYGVTKHPFDLRR